MLKRCRNVYDISLYKNAVFIAIAYALSSPLPNISFFVQTSEFESLNFRKKYLKIISSEAKRGIKLKLHRNIIAFSLSTKMAFLIAVAHALLLLRQLKSFH